jgi:hypothetical protein
VDRLFDWLGLIVIAGIIFVLARPGSLGPSLVEIGGGKIVQLVQTVTGGGTWR